MEKGKKKHVRSLEETIRIVDWARSNKEYLRSGKFSSEEIAEKVKKETGIHQEYMAVRKLCISAGIDIRVRRTFQGGPHKVRRFDVNIALALVDILTVLGMEVPHEIKLMAEEVNKDETD